MTNRAAKISDAARAFMAAAEAAPPLPDNLSMDEVRRLTRQSYAKAAKDAVIKHGVVLKEIEVAGIPCTRIIPQEVTPGRIMVYVFGGGFMVGSPFEDLPISTALATYLKCPVICPNYRLAPEHRFPAALDDVEAVVSDILKGEDQVVLAGESAGGNLILALHQRLRAKGAKQPVAMATLSPATDLGDTGDSGLADRDPLLTQARVDEVNATYVPGEDLTNPEISPIYGEYGPDTPPTIITTGTRDLFLSCCVRQERVMREAGAPVALRVWESMGHVFEFFPDMPEGDASLREIAAFLDECLRHT